MSLAILTSAVAQLADIEYQYRKVDTLPVFTKKNNLLLSSSHVQTILFDPEFVQKEDTYYFTKPSIVIDYFPDSTSLKGEYFSQQAFLSMYYRNIASDALVQNKLDLAFLNAQKAYQLDPASLAVINLIAVLHKRKGDLQTAEKIYQKGIMINKNNLALVSNYIVLLEQLGKYKQAEKLSQRLENLDDPNPYHWLEQALLAQQHNDSDKAIKFFHKVLKLAPYVHQAYQGLYQEYSKQGELQLAKAMLTNALQWTFELKDKKLYKQKLYQLKKNA